MIYSFTNKLTYEIPSKISSKVLDEMEEYCDSLNYKKAEVELSGVNTIIRDNEVSFICWDEWISGIIHNMIMSANLSYFKYDLTYFDGKLQSSVYTSDDVESFYSWHVDNINPFEYNQKLHERKLSCSFMLSDPNDYEGGELQFVLPGKSFDFKPYFKSYKPERGSIVVFPSWLPHRVRPVKSGTRKSLVAWVHGPLFK